MTEQNHFHVGRAWTGHQMEDECPCPQEPCGLVSLGKVVEDCPQHAFGRFKTMRQGHKDIACPSLKQVWETEDAVLIIMGTHDSKEALQLAKEYYADNEIDDYDASLEQFEAVAKKKWINRHSSEYESEHWADEIISTEEKEGWTPYISVVH